MIKFNNLIHINRIYEFSRHFKVVFIFVSIAIIIITMLLSNRLAGSLADEERKKVEIWANAMQEILKSENNPENINFLMNIIEGNTTIPIIITDSKGNVLQMRNVKEPFGNFNEFYKNEVRKFNSKHAPIITKIDENNVQYIYYDDSLLLKKLYYFPFIQLAVISIFILIAYLAFASTKRAEQNQVWLGLSKETAHQLGTPISSLLAWHSILKSRYNEDKLLTDMEKDVNRLRIIAERFSKIGSTPDLKPVNLNDTIQDAVQYIANRTSQKVSIQCHLDSKQPVFTSLNIPLFEWVIENLCKNAIDAMDGEGHIDVYLYQHHHEVIIDVKDTGKGIEKSKYKTIFTPGFTTKKRGWGLGLSLAKRIIEEYHKGKIFVKSSEINVGTTFRIVLKQ